ncbi:MAG: DASS family sodium-coupled anion symporter [Deltaproteobacteria bacterium]|nr:DASS family sodium-coupled anion symporter [Deltaproteobacteria bacterium]
MSLAEERFERGRRTVGLFVGPALFAFLWLLPLPGISTEAHRLAAVLGWILTYWICEPIPIPATALLGPVLCVVLGIAEPQVVFAPFANPVVFLFIGSFILAQGMIAHGLNERIALSILSAGWVAGRGRRLALAVGLIPLVISGWISDSATTAMIYPILIGILDSLHGTSRSPQGRRFSSGLLLTISYAALIGGVMTPVGTPPNLIGIGMLGRLADRHVGFFQWMTLAAPIALALGACMFAIMAVAFPAVHTDGAEAMEFVRRRRAALGPWSRGEKNALFAFVVAVVLWVLPGIVASTIGPKAATARLLERHLPEGVASLIAALLLFLLPTDWKARRFTLRWSDATRIHWGTILLFGGGLSLGGLMFSTHLAEVLGNALIEWSGVESVWGLCAISIALAIGLTEVTSNTATASMLVPVVIALANVLEVSPVPPTIGVCMGASMAFMLPVSTPSNAIVYGSGRVPITAMIRAGIVLDVLGFGVIFAGLRLLCPLLGLA